MKPPQRPPKLHRLMPKLGIHAGYSALTGSPLVPLSCLGGQLVPLSWHLLHLTQTLWLPRIVKNMLGRGRIGQVSVAQTLRLSQRRQIINRRRAATIKHCRKRQHAAVRKLTLPSASCSAAAASRTFLGFLFVEVCMCFLLRNLGRASLGSQDQRLEASDLEKQRKYLRLGLL